MTIQSRPHHIFVVLSSIALSLLLSGCSKPPGKPLESAPVIVSKPDYIKESNKLEGVVTNRTKQPLAEVTVTLRVYVGGDAFFARKVTIKDLKASEKRAFSEEDASEALKKESVAVSKIRVYEIETSEPARYSAK